MNDLALGPFQADAYSFPVERLNTVLESVRTNDRLVTLLHAQNVNPVERLRYNDHGPKHIETVLGHAIELYDKLHEHGVSFNGAADQGLEVADEPVIIALGTIFHDIGHIIHRHYHPYLAVPIAWDLVPELLEEQYATEARVRLTGEVLHAIVCHHTEVTPLTREAGVVRVADALDMERGRSRKPYEQGGRGINTISSQAIRAVSVKSDDTLPARIEIEMTSSAGIYQIDELLKAKLSDSGLEEHVRIVAVRVEDDDQLIDRIEL